MNLYIFPGKRQYDGIYKLLWKSLRSKRIRVFFFFVSTVIFVIVVMIVVICICIRLKEKYINVRVRRKIAAICGDYDDKVDGYFRGSDMSILFVFY